MSEKKKVLILSGGSGHASQAEAAATVFEKNGFDVKTIFGLTSSRLPNFYRPFYLYFPSLFQFPFRMGKQKEIRKAIVAFSTIYFQRGVSAIIRGYNPHLIISTFYLYNPAVVEVLKKGRRIPFFNLVSDPRTVHPLIFCPEADLNLLYDRATFRLGLRYGIPRQKLASIGWLVREPFYGGVKRARVCKRLGFDPRKLTVLICAGSEGTYAVLKILPAFLVAGKPPQIVLVSGKNSSLYGLGKAFGAVTTKSFAVWESQLKMKVFRFTRSLPELMAAADLVVGKAGPNLLFETVAAGKPFFAICHIHGQEDGNLEIIKRKKLGFVEERPEQATRLLLRIIDKPSILRRFERSIAREREYNQAAGERLLKLAARFGIDRA